MQKVAGFTSAHTHTHAHTHTLPPRLHILEKNALPMNKSSANWTNFLLTTKKKRKKAHEGGEEEEEGWGRQYQLEFNKLLSSHGNKLNKFSFKLISVSSVTHATYCIIHYIYTTYSACQTVNSDSLCKFNYVKYNNKIKPQWTPTNYIISKERERV